MPHKCVRCNKTYPDGSKELLSGCTCSSKFFFYISKENMAKAEEIAKKLSKEDKHQLEKDIKDIIGEKFEEDMPVILDLALINAIEPGKFDIDIVRLFKGEPVVYKLEDGKYIIDVATTFQKMKKK